MVLDYIATRASGGKISAEVSIMVGLVIVSHSALAEGVAELARGVGGADLLLAATGGLDLPDQPLGTDPMLVLRAIEEVYSDDGVLVLMDLGSAVLSAEKALDLLSPERRSHVVLCEAALVEGTVAAAVQARLGSPVAQVVWRRAPHCRPDGASGSRQRTAGTPTTPQARANNDTTHSCA
jgi:phosphocarrier protein FPr